MLLLLVYSYPTDTSPLFFHSILILPLRNLSHSLCSSNIVLQIQLEAAKVLDIWFVFLPISLFHLFPIYSLDKCLSLLTSQAFASFGVEPHWLMLELKCMMSYCLPYIPRSPSTEFTFVNEIQKTNMKLVGRWLYGDIAWTEAGSMKSLQLDVSAYISLDL